MIISLTGCGAPARVPEHEPPSPAPYDVESEGTFPPAPWVEPTPTSAARDLDVAVVDRGSVSHAPGDSIPGAGAVAAAGAAAGAAASEDRVRGFRVQIAACESLEIAEALRAEVGARFDENVYIEHDAPFYKVRVGDCATEQECLELRERVRGAGYASAWTVQSEIQSH